MAITRLWFFTLKPNTSFSDPAFLKLWTDVLELNARYTPTPGPSSSLVKSAILSQPAQERAHHFLYQSTNTTTPQQNASSEPVYVLICSYPSFALCAQADLAYVKLYHEQMSRYVRHSALRQLDMEDGEVVPALLSSSSRRRDGVDGEDGGAEEPTVTVAVSNSDPLVAEAMSSSTASLSGTKIEVPPPNVEISGADVFDLPPARSAGGGEDMFEAQRSEGRKWIRILRGVRTRADEIDVETYQLRQLLAR